MPDLGRRAPEDGFYARFRAEEVRDDPVGRPLDILEQQGRPARGQDTMLDDRYFLVRIDLARHPRKIPPRFEKVDKTAQILKTHLTASHPFAKGRPSTARTRST